MFRCELEVAAITVYIDLCVTATIVPANFFPFRRSILGIFISFHLIVFPRGALIAFF